MNRLFYLNHTPVNFYFNKSPNDFVVREVPLYETTGEGEHLVLEIRKKDMTTWDMLKALSNHIGIKEKEIGYAGLKDKEGMTTQYISLPKKHETNVASFSHPNIKILSASYHRNKIKLGHLKGNHFFIRLKKVSSVDALKLQEVFKKIEETGFPNYFGYQRFGRSGENHKEAKELLSGVRKERSKRVRKLLISSYQSHLFNLWLSKRVEISKMFDGFSTKELNNLYNFPLETIKQIKEQKHFFKLLPGDLMHHYPYGRLFLCEDLGRESERFYNREITVTGLLCGKRAKNSTGIAGNFEKDIAKEAEAFISKMSGARRFAWVWASDMKMQYIPEKAHVELEFFLPKGSYATVLLEELTHRADLP